MSNDKATAAYHPQTPAAAQPGWDRNDAREWAPVPASSAIPQQQVVVNVAQPKPGTNHVLHLLLSIVTSGLWVPVWIIVAAKNRRR